MAHSLSSLLRTTSVQSPLTGNYKGRLWKVNDLPDKPWMRLLITENSQVSISILMAFGNMRVSVTGCIVVGAC